MNTIQNLLLRIDKKLKTRDIQRTGLRFAHLLNHLPPRYPSLLAATAGLRSVLDADIPQFLRENLRALEKEHA